MSNILKSQPVKIALGIILGLGVIILIAFAVDANNQRSAIDSAKAKEIAMNEAGVSESTLSALDISDNNTYYTVYFESSGKDYSYDVEKTTGEILRASFTVDGQGQEMVDDQAPADTTVTSDNTTPSLSNTTEVAAIDEAKAKEIALGDAGIKESDTNFIWVSKDYDDRREVYDVEFYAGGVEYDYEILASDGTILKVDYDIESHTPQNGYGGHHGNNGSANTKAITLEEARDIALARVTGATSDNIRISADYDDGYLIYEGEIRYDGMEYEFEIDGYRGSVIEWSAESWYD